jgi:hypothetical protein
MASLKADVEKSLLLNIVKTTRGSKTEIKNTRKTNVDDVMKPKQSRL